MTLKKLTPCQAIKQYCRYSCCANDVISWKECSIEKCPLFPYRMGKRPKSKPFVEYSKKQAVLPINFDKNNELQVSSGVENE